MGCKRRRQFLKKMMLDSSHKGIEVNPYLPSREETEADGTMCEIIISESEKQNFVRKQAERMCRIRDLLRVYENDFKVKTIMLSFP